MISGVPASLSDHAIARAEIDAWRGRCLDLFAIGEARVGQTLQHAVAAGRTAKLPHLAGQRLESLIALIEQEKLTKKQRLAIGGSLERWKLVEQNRVCLAHGVVTELLDRSGNWSVQFDWVIYKSKAATPCRATFSKAEALWLESDLKDIGTSLSRQLGQIRTQLSASKP